MAIINLIPEHEKCKKKFWVGIENKILLDTLTIFSQYSQSKNGGQGSLVIKGIGTAHRSRLKMILEGNTDFRSEEKNIA
jgi:hypothetical protein